MWLRLYIFSQKQYSCDLRKAVSCDRRLHYTICRQSLKKQRRNRSNDTCPYEKGTLPRQQNVPFQVNQALMLNETEIDIVLTAMGGCSLWQPLSFNIRLPSLGDHDYKTATISDVHSLLNTVIRLVVLHQSHPKP